MGVVENLREEAVGVASLLILGAGFAAMFAGQSWFWMVWVVGFAVVLPIVGIALGEGTEGTTPIEDADTEDADETEADALEALKRRYADGELTETEFEARLERLLETEDPEAAREYLASERRERGVE